MWRLYGNWDRWPHMWRVLSLLSPVTDKLWLKTSAKQSNSGFNGLNCTVPPEIIFWHSTNSLQCPLSCYDLNTTRISTKPLYSHLKDWRGRLSVQAGLIILQIGLWPNGHRTEGWPSCRHVTRQIWWCNDLLPGQTAYLSFAILHVLQMNVPLSIHIFWRICRCPFLKKIRVLLISDSQHCRAAMLFKRSISGTKKRKILQPKPSLLSFRLAGQEKAPLAQQ